MRGAITRRLFAGLFSIGWIVSATAAPPPGRQNDIPYGSDPEQVLDLYTPATPGPHKLVLFLHGGGWVKGAKGVGRKIAIPLTAAGYALASANYRLVPETDVAGAVSDAAQAVGFLLSHAAQFGLDPNRFAIMGHSSGAHMAALLGTDQSYLKRAGVDPAKLAAVITLDGVFDVKANLTHFPSETRQEVFGTDPKRWDYYSPVARMTGMQSHPEFCVVHEDTNPRFIEQEGLYEDALRQHGEHLTTETAHGLSHAQLVQEFDNPAAPMAAFVLGCLKQNL
jgi:arylformamidase